MRVVKMGLSFPGLFRLKSNRLGSRSRADLWKDILVTRDDVIARIVPLMEDVFDEDALVYADNLTAADVAEWDSLSHVRFIVAIERAFGVRFATSEIEHFKNVGDLVTAITAKTAG